MDEYLKRFWESEELNGLTKNNVIDVISHNNSIVNSVAVIKDQNGISYSLL